MKRAINVLTALFVAIVLVGTGCKKYEDGPAFSLRSKKARLVNYWKIDKWFQNGTDYTDSMYVYPYYKFNDDNTGRYEVWMHDSYNDMWCKQQGNIYWEFSDKKDSILLYDSEHDLFDGFLILRLKEKELWLQKTIWDGRQNVVVEERFVPVCEE